MYNFRDQQKEQEEKRCCGQQKRCLGQQEDGVWSTGENLLPEVHLGCIVLCPGHVRLIVKDEIFLFGRRHCRPLNPRAEKISNRLREKS